RRRRGGEVFELLAVLRERVRGEVEPQRVLLALEELLLGPRRARGQRRRGRRRVVVAPEPEERGLPRGAVARERLPRRDRRFDGRGHVRALLAAVHGVESAAAHERLDRRLVDRARRDALAEVVERRERPALVALRDDRLDRLRAGALERAKAEAHVPVAVGARLRSEE